MFRLFKFRAQVPFMSGFRRAVLAAAVKFPCVPDCLLTEGTGSCYFIHEEFNFLPAICALDIKY